MATKKAIENVLREKLVVLADGTYNGSEVATAISALQKVRYWTFVVEGSGAFPVDMLRYDRCCPYEQEDVSWCFLSGNANRSAKMVSWVGPPEAARWNSFGWTVDMVREYRS